MSGARWRVLKYVYDRTLAALYDQTGVTDAAGQFTIDGLWPDGMWSNLTIRSSPLCPEFYDDSPDARRLSVPVNETA